VFDACGDDLAGETFRKVLAAKMALCPIPEDAAKRYQQRIALLLKKERDWIKDFVAEHGGLPDRIEGMSATCHEHQTSPDYVQLRAKLDSYVDGKTDPNTILPGACDAGAFSPSGP
jgi:hypothetical protein